MIILNTLSLKFAKFVKAGGLIIVNKSLADWDFSRDDVEVLQIKAAEIARELGDPKAQAANMVILGAYLRKRRPVRLRSIIDALRSELAGKGESVIKLNERALRRGWQEGAREV